MTSDPIPIAAIATAPGRGGIGVVRVSGATVAPIIQAICGAALAPRRATYLPFRDADGRAIDHGIAIHYPAPHSYTGEDVLELQGHGGPVVMRLLLARVLEAGAAQGTRLAAPGEFTQRAYLNDRMDLAQAEAVADLIDATTEAAARSAARSMQGEFSGAVHALVDSLIELRMLVEATLDFPEEEDVDWLTRHDAQGRLDALREHLARLLASARQGALLRTGLNVVLAGRPNVGKSSLLNALAGQDVAIVTPIAGTTRDRVIQAIELDGIPLNVIDTAGLREAADEVERIGIERTWQEVARADVVVRLRAARSAGSGEAGPDADADDVGAQASAIAARLPAGVPVIDVVNKVDLTGRPARIDAHGAIHLSARTGEGMALLRERLLAVAGWENAGEGVVLARERHLQALREAAGHLVEADAQLRAAARMPELFAEELRLAQRALESITGRFSADDLLGEIFGRFCIGK